jgi:hypothetical protein
MFRFIRAVVQALIQLTLASINTATAFLDWLLAKLTGGGGAAEPVKNLEAALPDESRIEEARDLERGKAAAADLILKQSPAMQVKMFASMSAVDRAQADLTLLSEKQQDWLFNLSDDELKVVAETSDRRVEAALEGEHNALTAIRSVGQAEADDGGWLAHRITEKRATTLATAPSHNLGYAIH